MSHTGTIPLLGRPPAAFSSSEEQALQRVDPGWLLRNETSAFVTRSLAVAGVLGVITVPLLGVSALMLCTAVGLLAGLVLGKEPKLRPA